MSAPPSTAEKTRTLGLLSLVVLLSMSLWFSASAVLPQLADEWALSPSLQAWMTISVQLGFVVGALLAAILNLADRISAPRLVAGSALLGALANAAIPLLAGGPTFALVLRFLTGAALAGVYPPGMKIMASWCRQDRGLCIGILVGALAVGKGMPHLLNAVTGEADGLPHWRLVLYGTSVQALLGAGLAMRYVRMGPHLARAAAFDWRHATEGLSQRATRLANFGYFGHMWELYAMWGWAPLLLAAGYARAGWSSEGASLASFGLFLAGGASCVLAGRWADRWGRTRITIGALVVSGFCCLVAGLLLDSPLALTLVCLIWGFAVVADSAQFSAAISELADPRFVGTALQMQTSLGFLLTLVTLWLVPVLTDAAGYPWAFAVLVLGPIFGAVSMWRLRRLPESAKMASGQR